MRCLREGSPFFLCPGVVTFSFLLTFSLEGYVEELVIILPNYFNMVGFCDEIF